MQESVCTSARKHQHAFQTDLVSFWPSGTWTGFPGEPYFRWRNAVSPDIRRRLLGLCEKSQINEKYIYIKGEKYLPLSGGVQLTPLSRVNDDDFAERPVSFIVVDSHLHFERSERGERLVSVLVHGGVCRGHHLLLPASGSVGPKGNDVPEALAVLELLRHRLETLDRWF